ncbi:MAG: T9SS type A sorting domain-containing protein [Bacteroidia bacterium]|nr:T9SS type A sorting domain-containing protein [Bacteroidia bacterium]
MKHLFFLFSLLMLTTLNVVADSTQNYEPMRRNALFSMVQSNEIASDTVTQKFSVDYKVYFTDTTNQTVRVKLAFPLFSTAEPRPAESGAFFTFPGNSNIISGSYNPGDSISNFLSIGFNKNNLPFYYQVVQVQIWDNAGEHKLSSENFMVYFTPWNTIEIWNEMDFESLQRVWFSQSNNHDTRVYINKDSLPTTDLTLEEFANDSIPKSYYTPKGLGYMIPVHYIEDEDFERRADGCGTFKKRWKGQVTGRIMARVNSDFGGSTDINISGIKVVLMQRDGSWIRTDKSLGVGFTDLNGEFLINVDKCIRSGIGNNIELYIKVESVNHQETIIVKRRIGGARTVSVNNNTTWEYNDGNTDNIDIGTFWPETVAAKPQLLHWADRCRNFINDQLSGENFSLGTRSAPLVIKRMPLGLSSGMFFPGGYANVGTYLISPLIGVGVSFYLSNKDGIYVDRDIDSELDEDLIYHEFGHYLMWYLQGKSWINPLEASWGNHSFRYNGDNEKITWTEGWAGGIGAIFDIAFRDDDGEAGWDDINNLERRLRFGDFPEDLENNVRIGGTSGQNIENRRTVTHGFVSEMNVVCAIMDLHDGEGKGNILAPSAAEEFDDREFPNQPVSPTNLPQDLANFTFAQICKPLLNKQGSGFNSTVVVQNAMDYAYELARTLPCSEKHLVYDIWEHNMISDFEEPREQLTSTDVIRQEEEITVLRFAFTDKDADNDAGADLRDNGNYTFNAYIDVSEINGNTGSFNLIQPHPNWSEYISDPLTVTGGAILHINDDIESNWVNDQELRPAQGSHLMAYFCNVETTIEEDSRIIVGSALPTGGYITPMIATAYIGSGTTIVLESGSELVINNNSKLVIEAGGRIDFHPGAKIILNGDNAVLEIKGDIRLMPNADFAVEGGAQGFGYIKIHRNENHAWKKPIYGMGNNKILLEGSSISHKLIEVTGNEGWFVPNSISTVQISNCQIELGSTSRLNLEMANTLVMEDVQVLPIHSTQSPRHKGIQIWGWGAASALTRVKITHGENGVLYYPLWQHEQQSDINVRNHVRTHTVEDCDFENNQTGIKAIRVPVWVKDSRFSGYETSGILTYGTVSGRVYIVNNLFHHSAAPSTSTGILFQGTSGINNVNIRKNEITDNRVAIHGFAATVFAGCNQIYGNASAFHLEEHADLYASTQRLSGYNTLSSNPNAIMSRYNGMVWLNEGYNILSSNPNHLQKDLSFFLNGKIGTTLPTPNLSSSYNFINPTPEYMLADGQYAQADWTDGNTHAPFNTFLYNRYTPNMNQYYTFDFGAPPISVTYTYLTEEIQTECAQSKWEDFSLPPVSNPADYADEIYSHDNLASGFLVFNTPNFPNLELNDIRASLFESGYSLTQYSPTAIIHLYKEVLVDNYISNTAVNVGYNELLKQLLEQVAYWSENMHINNRVSDSLQEGSEYTMLHNLLEDILTQSTLDSNHFMHGDSFGLRTMQAELKRVAGNYQSALAAIENIRSTALSPFENFVLDKLECQNHAEQDLREGVVSPDSVFSLYPCLDGYFVEVPSENENRVLNTDIITSSQSALWVYPNPASKELFVQTATEAGTYFIYNITGSLVAAGRLNDKRIDISELSEGMYFIRLNTAAQTCHAKFVVAKE